MSMKLSLGPVLFSLGCLAAGCGTAASPARPPAQPTPTLYQAPLGTAQVAVGSTAPDFATVAHDGTKVRLSSLQGSDVVLFFYSKDDAPGPTREATAFRDAWGELERRGVVVIGISTDTLDSHKEFAQRLRLPFHLVSDTAGAIAQAYGVDDAYGFLARDTVLIGADGRVKKLYRSVDVTKHVAQVLADLQS
jgi:peroxiredoxin Q/BCP